MPIIIATVWIIFFWVYLIFSWKWYIDNQNNDDYKFKITLAGLIIPVLVLVVHITNIYFFGYLNQSMTLHPLLSNPLPLMALSLIAMDVIMRRYPRLNLWGGILGLGLCVIFSISLFISSQTSPTFYRQFILQSKYCPLSNPTVVAISNNQAQVYKTSSNYQLLYVTDDNPEIIFCRSK